MLEQMRWIAALLDKSDRARMRVLGLMLAVSAVLETVAVGAVVPFIDLINDPGRVLAHPAIHVLYDRLGFTRPREFLIAASLAWVVLVVVKNLYNLKVVALQEGFLGRKTAEIASRLFVRYVKADWSEHLRRDSAHMVSTAEHATGWPLTATFLALFALASEGMVVLFIAALLLVAEPEVTATVGAMLGLCFAVAYWVIKRWVNTLSPRRVEVYDARVKILQEGLGALKEIKVFGRDRPFIERYHAQCLRTGDLSRSINILQNAPRLVVEVLVVAAIVLVVVMVLHQGRPAGRITVVLGLFALGAFRLMPSMNRIVVALSNLRYCRDTVKAIHHDLVETHPPPPPPATTAIPPLARDLTVEDVGYVYDERGTAALDGISFTLERGRALALIGRSGSGKTTLVDVILGLLPPGSGRVLVDGVDVALNIAAWQRQIGYVPQSVSLIDASLRENIAFGVPPAEIDEARLAEVVAQASLTGVVEQMPRGLDTALGDRGVRLSGGQRQRVGIARALYHRPEVLVFDEATSALDMETEREVSSAIEGLHGICTMIIIAHRLSTVRHCDRLLLLADGRVAAAGSFDEMLRASPDFRRMVQLAELAADVEACGVLR